MRTGSFLNSSEKKLVHPNLANPFKLELPHSVKKLEHTRLSRNEGWGAGAENSGHFMTEKKSRRKPDTFAQLSRTFEVLSPAALMGYEGVPEQREETKQAEETKDDQ